MKPTLIPILMLLLATRLLAADVPPANPGVKSVSPTAADVYVGIQGEPAPADWKRSVFNGLAQIIVQAGQEPGELKLTTRSEGLDPATLSVPTRSCAPRPAVP